MTEIDARVMEKRIADLSPEKRAVLQMLMQKAQEQSSGIRPRDRRQDPPPLSYAQRQLWFLDRLAPGNWFYNESTALHLTFPVDVVALERALDELVVRHESLRTAFGAVDDEPVQMIVPALRVPLQVVDLTHLSPEMREAESRRLSEQDAQTPFDLSRVPLLRATLIRRNERDTILLFTLHHIVFDGWSFNVMLRELSAIYEARVAGRSAALPPLQIQYADYAVWQRKALAGRSLDAQLQYWKSQLTDVPVLDLCTDRPRPPVQRFHGARRPVSITRRLYTAARALSAAHGMTLFMTLLTVFKTLLLRYSGQSDIAVGVPMANRHRPELEPLIGFFVNTLVMRTDLSGDPTFEEALARVRKTTLDAFTNQDVPFEKLVEEINPSRDLSRNPLYQVTFQIYGGGDSDPGTRSIETAPAPFEVNAHSAKFDLRVDLVETGDGLTGFIEYDTDLFDDSTATRIARHFEQLFESAVTDLTMRLSELSMLTAAERSQLVVETNKTATSYPRDATINSLFEQIAAEYPESVALVSDADVVTYDALNRRANRLTRHLRGLGVGAGTVVGVTTERSPEMIVAILGVLKAGAAYLPVDLDDPRERVVHQLEDAAVDVVVTRDRQLFHLADRGIRVVALSFETAAIEQEPDTNLDVPGTAEELAYVMFTSGSTGKPKGVCVPHRGVVRLVRDTNFFSAGSADVFLQFAPLSFDASTFEIWGALLNGARLRLFPPHLPSLEELAATIQHDVTVVWLTAGMFHQLADSYPTCFRGVRQLLAGGDQLSPTHVGRVLEKCPECTVINGYGPTENTTFTCTSSVKSSANFDGTFPIGRPIANTRVYVLDSYGRPVGAGVPGELYVGGDGLARGYLNDAALTAVKFVSSTLPEARGERLYRTGDRVRFRHDGCLEFLGRLDRQVKIRGFRVEPGEIEAVLRTHPAVKDVVCIVAVADDRDKRVIAYVACEDQPPLLVSELRRFAQQRLPEFMVPASIVVLPALPLTKNGKVDRAALPSPDRPRGLLDARYVAPTTETERAVSALWQEILGVEQVGMEDNFFDLGGHSLLIVLLHNRLRETFRKELSIVDLFRHPTVGSLARLLAGETA